MAQRRSRIDHDKILKAARRIAGRDGVDALALRPLAASLDVTAPALYSHFESKEALLEALAADEFTRLLAKLESAGRGIDDPVALIKAQCRAYIAYALANPSLFEVIFLFRPSWAPSARGTELPAASKAFEMSAKAVEDAIAAGLIAPRDPLLASLTIWAAVHGLAMLLLAQPRLGKSFESELITSVIDSIVAGLETPPTPPPS